MKPGLSTGAIRAAIVAAVLGAGCWYLLYLAVKELAR